MVATFKNETHRHPRHGKGSSHEIHSDVQLLLSVPEALAVRYAITKLAKQRQKDSRKWSPDKVETNVSQLQYDRLLAVLRRLDDELGDQLPPTARGFIE